MTQQVECPNCGARVRWEPASRWRPFCSERCKMVDLGAWFSEERGIPGEDLEELPGESDSEALSDRPGDWQGPQ